MSDDWTCKAPSTDGPWYLVRFDVATDGVYAVFQNEQKPQPRTERVKVRTNGAQPTGQ